LLSRGSLGEASRGFILRLLFSAAFTPRPLAHSSHKVRKVQPLNDWPTLCPDQCNGMGEWEIRWKMVCMTGTDDGFSEITPVATQNLWT
jgi:hypothetical protein